MKILVKESKLKALKAVILHYGMQVPDHQLKDWYKDARLKPDSKYRFLLSVDGNQESLTPSPELISSNLPKPDADYTTVKMKDKVYDPDIFIPIKLDSPIDQLISNIGGIMPATNTMVIGDPGIGKTSITISMLATIHKNYNQLNYEYDQQLLNYATSGDPELPFPVKPKSPRLLFISGEMNDIDMLELVQYYPEISDIEILFLGDYADKNSKLCIESVVNKGWDVILVDSLAEVIEAVRESTGMSTKHVESWFLDLMSKNNTGTNDHKIYSAFYVIQQVTKSGQFVGSNRMKHMMTAQMEIRYDYLESRATYIHYVKNRRGKVFNRMYFKMVPTGIEYDIARYSKEIELKSTLASYDSLEDVSEEDFKKLLGMGSEDLA